MKITEVRIKSINSAGKLKAIASITFDNEFVIHDLKIIDSRKGLFVAMPSRKTPDGGFKDIAHPLTPKIREELQDIVLAKYNEMNRTKPDELKMGSRQTSEGKEENIEDSMNLITEKLYSNT